MLTPVQLKTPLGTQMLRKTACRWCCLRCSQWESEPMAYLSSEGRTAHNLHSTNNVERKLQRRLWSSLPWKLGNKLKRLCLRKARAQFPKTLHATQFEKHSLLQVLPQLLCASSSSCMLIRTSPQHRQQKEGWGC